MLSDSFSEGKLKDLRGPFPLDQPTELDPHGFLYDSDLEDVDDDAKPTAEVPETTPENRGSPLKSSIFGTGFVSQFAPQISQSGSEGDKSSIFTAQSEGPAGSGSSSQSVPRISQSGSAGDKSSIFTIPPVDPNTHLGKVVVLRDISFVT